MQTARTVCQWVCFIGVLQFAMWTSYYFEAATPDAPAISMHTYGVGWSPWLTRTCSAPDVGLLGDCAAWRHEFHPLSASALLLLAGLAGGVAARRLRPKAARH